MDLSDEPRAHQFGLLQQLNIAQKEFLPIVVGFFGCLSAASHGIGLVAMVPSILVFVGGAGLLAIKVAARWNRRICLSPTEISMRNRGSIDWVIARDEVAQVREDFLLGVHHYEIRSTTRTEPISFSIWGNEHAILSFTAAIKEWTPNTSQLSSVSDGGVTETRRNLLTIGLIVNLLFSSTRAVLFFVSPGTYSPSILLDGIALLAFILCGLLLVRIRHRTPPQAVALPTKSDEPQSLGHFLNWERLNIPKTKQVRFAYKDGRKGIEDRLWMVKQGRGAIAVCGIGGPLFLYAMQSSNFDITFKIIYCLQLLIPVVWYVRFVNRSI